MSASKLKYLKACLEALPDSLPIADESFPVSQLLHFSLDPDWVQDIGEEMAINRQLEAALNEYLPRNDAGIFFIKHRGPALVALADVLGFWLEKYPKSVILQLWLKNAADSAHKCITQPSKSNAGCSDVGKKTATKVLVGTKDPKYSSDDESEDDRAGGRTTFPLLLKISKICHLRGESRKRVRCLASKGCLTTWATPRDKTRILKHAMGCGYLAKIDSSLVEDAMLAMSKKHPHLVDQLKKKVGMGSGGKRARSDDEKDPDSTKVSNPFSQAHSLKCSRTEPTLRALKEEADKALVEYIVCCGIAPRTLQSSRFKRFVNVLNKKYLPPSRTTFEDSLVPAYAASVQVIVTEHLRTCRDLTLSFDGGKLGKKKFYSVHATTPDRQSFCLELDDVSRLSQTGDYIYELLEKVITKMRNVLAFMSLSSYTLDHFDVARKELNITRGLQLIGETCFGTIYWSLDSVLQGIPPFVKIIQDKSLGIESDVLEIIFADDDTVFEFQRDLKRLGAVLMPFARAIQCLEAKETTPADVYTYWLAIVAHLQDLMKKDNERSKYNEELKNTIRQIANNRFAEIIDNKRASNIYLTAFVLDPENHIAPILSNPNPLAPSVTQSKKAMVDGIGLSLLQLLKREYGDEYRESRTVEEAQKGMKTANPRLAGRTPREAITALKTQFQAYVDGVEPFTRKRSSRESLREYWKHFLNDDESDVLAALAIKIFSVTPVSMVDERAMSVPKPRKPVTVNWRDIRKTIDSPGNQATGSGKGPAVTDEEQSEDNEEHLDAPEDPMNDPLSWLDEGLPDLSSSNHRHFDLALQFEVGRYASLLADSVSDGERVRQTAKSHQKNSEKGQKNASAAVMAPSDSDWATW
ncbi:hypothetical protein HYPSUDRAFT_71581 [Hypholoma sublateritium FD-334 SS-4]|uniref:Uncharacterized protein n=1 Tax=Hypholoma sublateritium (strain FD-334 SS-4) TaxID=945553 RepID=A0A0D2NHQ0_HYPSF|nr:hypothetical protein HYPSUDRAFT_71581 [Hypholoma sublateritium FD-334 SS-4]